MRFALPLGPSCPAPPPLVPPRMKSLKESLVTKPVLDLWRTTWHSVGASKCGSGRYRVRNNATVLTGCWQQQGGRTSKFLQMLLLVVMVRMMAVMEE